ncbi:hypothetical protein LSH36_437g01010 [Paralvinella palmiformis]|uniref:MIF4G domain-containing protein n=1 Tax=Paralvinella palmiformis TaxID=53620 RepID=A0AAD9JC83_9ANNE|nr:hypothetical protein LSH36_437g01010 [Paralvinella palmiformis]
MTSKGRARGRGMTPEQPVRPGGGQSLKDPVDELNILVKDLSLSADEREMVSVREVALKACTSEEKMEKVFESLYQRCYEDWRFSLCAANISCQVIASCDAEHGKAFRNLFLKRVQSDFKNKDKLRTESHQKFLGAASFLCQIYCQLLDESGSPFTPLTESVMEILELLLDDKATDVEMHCAAEQFFVVGKTLQASVEKIRLTGLRNKVKDKIIHAVGSKEVRTELIKVIEGFASEWKHFQCERIMKK